MDKRNGFEPRETSGRPSSGQEFDVVKSMYQEEQLSNHQKREETKKSRKILDGQSEKSQNKNIQDSVYDGSTSPGKHSKDEIAEIYHNIANLEKSESDDIVDYGEESRANTHHEDDEASELMQSVAVLRALERANAHHEQEEHTNAHHEQESWGSWLKQNGEWLWDTVLTMFGR
jgi:CRISPR/Cas system-associated endoribonuclease Cas2